MCTKKILVSCTVVSLQDARFVYPCCKFCLSRSTEDPDLRSRCIKCGFTCDVQHVDYRYRLSLKVSRGRNIFGVTVFGGCLNSFFGITAGGLQRFLDSGKLEGPQSVHQLLLKAVEDCFIGKSFVFGFKLSSHEAECCLFDEYTSSLDLGVGSARLVACQILSTNEGFVGMTVFDYLQRLLQASSHPSCSASHEAICQSQQKDSQEDSCENSLPLCARSYSQTSSTGLTQLWQPTSDMVLCFSTEETSGHSLQQMVVDDVKCVLSPNTYSPRHKPEPKWPTKELSLLSQSSEGPVKSVMSGVRFAADSCHTVSSSKNVEYFGTHERPSSSLALSSTLSPIVDKIDSPVALTSSVAHETLNLISTMSNGNQLKRSFSNYWSSPTLPGLEHNASSFEKSVFSHSGQNASFALEDAPLSEALGSFISTEPQISEPVNMDVLKPPCKCNTHERDQATHKKIDCVLTPLWNITNVIRGTVTERSQKRMHRKRKLLSLSKPCLPGTPKVSQIPKDSSSDIKNVVSDNLTKNPVKMAFHLECDKRGREVIEVGCAVSSEIQSQGMNEQESPSGGLEDEYNCSADLFWQSSADVSIPDVTDRMVTDCDEINIDCLMDRNVSEHVFRSFHFAPSLQSTPISYPYNHKSNSYGQERTLSKKCSNSPCSKKQITCPSRIRVLNSHSSARQGPEAGKPDLNQIQSSDFVFKNSNFASENFRKRSLTAACEVQSDVEHQYEDFVLLTDTNEWSRDLFAD